MSYEPLFIGVPENNLHVSMESYLSDYNFGERKVIVWDPLSLVGEFTARKVPINGKMAKERFIEVVEQLMVRGSVMQDFLNHGGDLIVILRDLKFPGLEANLYTVLRNAEPVSATGAFIAAQGEGELLEVLEELNTDLRYTAMAKAEDLVPLLVVPNSDEVVGGYCKTDEGGYIVFLPPTAVWNSGNPNKSPINGQYLERALRIPSLLRKQEGTATDLPVWASGFQLEEEQDTRVRIIDQEKVIADASNVILEERTLLSSFDIWKQLFAGTGNMLETAVLKALSEIGLSVVEGVRGEVDVLARWGETILAIEVKGLIGPCKRRNVVQGKNWIAHCESVLRSEPSAFDATELRYAEKLRQIGVPVPVSDEDQQCEWPIKGLLVINTHRETPLSERNDPSEPPFPDSVVSELRRNRFCAMTGVQLLGLRLAATANASKSKLLIEELVETVGVYGDFSDWREFLLVPK